MRGFLATTGVLTALCGLVSANIVVFLIGVGLFGVSADMRG